MAREGITAAPLPGSALPRDVTIIINVLDLDPPSTAYTCCPACYAVYLPPSPHRCTRLAGPDSEEPCGSALYDPRKANRPLRTMMYYGIANWLGDLLCRKEIEDAIDASRLKNSPAQPPDGCIHDTWYSPAVQRLLDPLTGRPFIDFDDDELHIVVRLSEDGFHPFGKRPGGKSISDNLCSLATIPGPGTPSLDQMNGPLSVAVDELLALAQEDGVFVTRTNRFPFGRKVRVLLLHQTGDLPASRQLCGFSAATSTHFCPYCTLTYQERNNVEYRTWRPRHWSLEKRFAEAWRDASTDEERKLLVDEHGLRWSELHRLHYWDPMRNSLPDASHMFARIFKHHLRGIFGMSITLKDDIGLEDNHEARELEEAWLILTRGDSAAMDRLSPNARRRLVEDIKKKQPTALQVEGRWNYDKRTRALKDYRITAEILDQNGKVRAKEAGPRARANPKAKAVLGKARLADLSLLLRQLKKPSWLPIPTRRPGDPAEGKLKSSATRRLAEVWLPISLIREWGPYPENSREHKMLVNYMHLISASLLAHQRKMRPATIRHYHEEAYLYLKTRAEIFPDVSVTPYEHTMLHFSWFLERYGPMHAWQQLLMEQRNGDLQKIPTNYRFGKLTLTHILALSFTLNRRAGADHLPKLHHDFDEIVEVCNERFSKNLKGNLRNHHIPVDEHFRINDEPVYWDDKQSTTLLKRSQTYQLLVQWVRARDGLGAVVNPCVLQHKAITYLGQKFQVHGSRTEGDTCLVYFDGRELADNDVEGFHSTWSCGHIMEIFSHNRISCDAVPVTETFFLIKPYPTLSPQDARGDYFRQFPYWGGRLHYNRLSPDAVLVNAHQVACQGCCISMKAIGVREDCILVVPVRV
ncbi:hypothetical protein EV714DRAFT_222295 [Schizophyllum commune]